MPFPPQVTMAVVQARAQSRQAQQYAGITLSKAGEWGCFRVRKSKESEKAEAG